MKNLCGSRFSSGRLAWALLTPTLIAAASALAAAAPATVTILTQRVLAPLSQLHYGACLEDVNHEVYGGIDSQMLFGESFQEPPLTRPVRGFEAHGGRWEVQQEALHFTGAPGDKLVSEIPAFANGVVGIEVRLPNRESSNAGLILRVSRPGPGADNFDGYEVALDAAHQLVRLGRHRHNWELLREFPCAVPPGEWVPLQVRLTGTILEITVMDRFVGRHDDGPASLAAGTVGLRAYQTAAQFRNLWVRTGDDRRPLPFVAEPGEVPQISAQWRRVQSGTASGNCRIVEEEPLVGRQSQRITFLQGDGRWGLENQGLNRWGLALRQGKVYEGVLWARAAAPTKIDVALETSDGARLLAQRRLLLLGSDWQRLEFNLKPNAPTARGRFSVTLPQPGTVDLGYAALQPGPWGRFRHLPVRRDVAEALIDQGLTVLRYGGSLVNAPEYRWKNMVGPRERRPPYRGTWYPHSSNGWGIPDFLNFCEAAKFVAVPAFNADETPQDLVDFLEYANGPASSPWGRQRAEDGHPAPYRLRYLQLGNEERVDEAYFAKFKACAEALWSKDPDLVLVVGDFAYSQPILDPQQVKGAASGITHLGAHRRILELAREHRREVWFDVHVWTSDPWQLGDVRALPSYVDALDRLVPGALHRVVVFELNANNHDQRRALANAWTLGALAGLSERVPIVCSANCLQPDGQNDNGWDQGLLFLNPSQVWLQPPGLVTRLLAEHHEPLLVGAETDAPPTQFQITAQRSQNGRVLVLRAVHLGREPLSTILRFPDYRPRGSRAQVAVLAAALDATNTAAEPERVRPRAHAWPHGYTAGQVEFTFAPHSVTVLRFE